MTKLYPIGTQLITRRLSQAALAEELGFLSYDCFNLEYTTWSVTVTEDNQPWLSPLIMVGDYVHFKKANFGFEVNRIVADEVFESDEPFWYASIEDEPEIISRFYPNGQRASLIEFDEVILPPEPKGE